MKEAPFNAAITGPIEDPRTSAFDPTGLAAQIFDEGTFARLQRVADEKRFSTLELIREGTLRYLDLIENDETSPRPA
jgi:hypothetical protein